MKTLIVIVIIIGLLAASCRPSLNVTETNREQIEEKLIDYQNDEAIGAEVTLLLKEGENINGELLSVRENSLMIFNSSACKDNTKKWECVDQVMKDEIEKLIIEGNSNVMGGLVLGSIAGLFSLVFTTEKGGLGLPSSKYSDDVTGGVMVGCIIVGGVIGILTSTADEEIEPFSEYDINGLSVYAKYPYEEPRDLEEIK